MRFSAKQYAVALYESTLELEGVKLDKVIRKFAEFLVKKHCLSKANDIINEFEKYSKKQAGILEIKITSARELDQQIINKIKNTFGAHVEASIDVDNDLIGGIRVKTEDKILDGSIRTQLKNLQLKLTA